MTIFRIETAKSSFSPSSAIRLIREDAKIYCNFLVIIADKSFTPRASTRSPYFEFFQSLLSAFCYLFISVSFDNEDNTSSTIRSFDSSSENIRRWLMTASCSENEEIIVISDDESTPPTPLQRTATIIHDAIEVNDSG